MFVVTAIISISYENFVLTKIIAEMWEDGDTATSLTANSLRKLNQKM